MRKRVEQHMLPTKMRVIEISKPGEPEVLQQGARDVPLVVPNEVLVKVSAAGVNGPDQLQRRGLYPPPKGASDLLGLEVSGEVVAMGDEVSHWQVGNRLCALTNGGGYAEYVAINADHCLPIPDGVDEIDAAGLCETYFTVWSNLFLDHEVETGNVLLIHGGAGGIGSTTIQLAKNLGMRVFTTCSSEENIAYCEGLGAERAINYKTQDFVEIVREAGGADLIVDFVGGDYVEKNFKCAKQDARVVQLAFRKGSKVEIDLMPIMLKRLTLTGSTLRPRPPEFKARIAADLRTKVWPWFGEGKLETLTHKVFSFDEVQDAHRMIDAGGHRGKILLRP